MLDTKSKNVGERSYKFAVDLTKFLRSLGRDIQFSPLSNQLLRCGTSVGANVAEAQGAHSRKDFANFYTIALKSCRETTYWLDIFRDGLEIKSPQLAILKEEAGEISRMLASSIISLRTKSNDKS